MPASPGTSTRSAAVNRPKNTALPRRRRITGSRPIVPVSSRSPNLRPIRYPAESPITAPDTAATATPQSGTVPREAATPPRMTAISPGNTNPTNAEASSAGNKNTSAATSHPGSSRILPVRPVATACAAAITADHHPGGRGRQEIGVKGAYFATLRRRHGQRPPAGPVATGGAIAAANPGLITVLISARRSSNGANALFIALIVSHWMSDQPYPNASQSAANSDDRLTPLISRLSVLTVTRNDSARSSPIGCSLIDRAAPVCTLEVGHISSGIRRSLM